MARRRNSAQSADKWARNLGGAAQSMREGVNAVTESPCLAASKKADKMLANITEAVVSGRWSAQLAKVTREDWIRSMEDKGIARATGSVTTAKPKVAAFLDKLFPYIDAGAQRLASMSTDTFQDRMARMTFWAEYMHNMPKYAG